MLKVELHNRDASDEPAARFATAREIEIAEELRRRLEERCLAPPAPKPSWPSESGNDR